jgi:hypothetical protein
MKKLIYTDYSQVGAAVLSYASPNEKAMQYAMETAQEEDAQAWVSRERG